MDQIVKLRHTFDVLFGDGTSKRLPKDMDLVLSRKTGRIRTVTHQGRLLCTLRIDGGLAITVYCAQLLLDRKFRQNCIEITKDAAPFVVRGRSVFCKHVIWCGKNVGIYDDVPILFQGKVIAVGKAILSTGMIVDLKKGVAVRIRDSLKSSNGELKT